MQQPLSLTWKFFRIANYLQIAGALGVLGLFAYEFENMIFHSALTGLLFILFIIGFLLAITNAGINLLLLERYYPATLPGKILWRWGSALFVLSIIFLVILSFLFAISLANISLESNYGYHKIDLLAAAFISVMLITAIPVLWLQVVLRKTIRRNDEATIERFLQKEND